MNQILVTEDTKKKNSKIETINVNRKFDSSFKIQKSESAEIKDYVPNVKTENSIQSIVRFLAIALIIFGIAISSNGSFALVNEIKRVSTKTIPIVTAERSGNTVKLVVKSDIGIRNVKYSWNNSQEYIISGRNQKEVDTNINIISGNNKLNITVIDINNNTTKYVKNYVQEAVDTTEPIITISNEDPKIKISVTDDTKLQYITYKYGDEEEKTIYATEDNPTTIETYIDDVQSGTVTLYVHAVDASQNESSKTQEVKGSKKPKILVTANPNDLSEVTIKATDEEGLRMLVFYLNDQQYKTNPDISLDLKEFSYTVHVQAGSTTIKVQAYNINDQVAEFTAQYNY